MAIQIGVIGTGVIGSEHIRRLEKVVNGAKVVAVFDMNQERAKGIAEQYQAVCYPTGKQVIWDSNVHAVVIASWDPAHVDYILECIKANKYVLCEKPLAISAKECLDILEAEQKLGKRLVQVGFVRRYDRGYHRLKEVIESGKIGKPLMIHCCHRNKMSKSKHRSELTIKTSGIHDLDILRWMLEEDYKTGQVITVKKSQNSDSGLLEPQIVLLETQSGVRIDVEFNMDSGYGYDIQCEVVGEKGTIRLPDPNTVLMRFNGEISYQVYEDCYQRFVEAYDIEFQEWLNGIKSGKIIGPSAWDSYVACVTAEILGKARTEENIEAIQFAIQPDFYK